MTGVQRLQHEALFSSAAMLNRLIGSFLTLGSGRVR